MKVRHFLLYGSLDPKFGGPTYSVPIQCIGTQKAGAEMSFVVYEASKPYEDCLIKNGVEMINLPNPQGKFERTWATKLKDHFYNCKDLPDILHFHGVWMPANYRIANFGIKHHIPYVINPRGDLETTRINYNILKKWKKQVVWALWGKRIVNKAACVIATSEQERDSIRRLGVTSPIAIIPNGIELDAFPNHIIHRYRGKKIVLFLSRVNPIKGIELLLDAWSKIDPKLYDDWELHIAGNSDPKNYIHILEKKVNQLNLSKSVHFIGSITGEEKLRKYQDSNLFILPTLNENFGNVIAEAMMCECPVITTKNAPWGCIDEEKCGWWINLSVEDIVTSLTEAMHMSDEERHELGQRGRKCIINRYSAQVVAKQTMEVYNWILDKGPKPDFVN